jgi:D-citramalate synthase
MSVRESKLTLVSKLVESYSGIRVPPNKPVIGDSVFTQTSGIHADGDQKNQLYYNDLLPERFGRKRLYALGKTSGKANIRKNLEEMGIELDFASMRKVTELIIEMGDKKESVTQ